MKVKAEHWINVNGTWHQPGEVYETDEQSPVPTTHEDKEATGDEAPRRGRKRKAEE